MTLEISETTMRMLEAEAARQHTNPEVLANELIQIGLTKRLENSKGFGAFLGLWSDAEAEEFKQAIAPLSTVDEELWREKNLD
jgi:hypothetical protein